MSQPTINRVYFTIKVLMPGKRRYQFLGSGHRLTHLRVHAIQYSLLTTVDAVAEQIMRDNPGAKAKVQPFD